MKAMYCVDTQQRFLAIKLPMSWRSYVFVCHLTNATKRYPRMPASVCGENEAE